MGSQFKDQQQSQHKLHWIPGTNIYTVLQNFTCVCTPGRGRGNGPVAEEETVGCNMLIIQRGEGEGTKGSFWWKGDEVAKDMRVFIQGIK